MCFRQKGSDMLKEEPGVTGCHGTHSQEDQKSLRIWFVIVVGKIPDYAAGFQVFYVMKLWEYAKIAGTGEKNAILEKKKKVISSVPCFHFYIVWPV